MSKALDGVRILDFTHVQSGPTCTQLLAWLGADCIKVERPGVGDITRGQLRDIPDVDSLYFTMLNHNKRSITIDAPQSAGQVRARGAGEDLRRDGGELRARRARPHGLHLGAHPGAEPAHDPRVGEGLRSRALRGLQGLRERRAMRRRFGFHDRLRRRPAVGHRRPDRRFRHRTASRPRHRLGALSAPHDRPRTEGAGRDAGRRAEPLPREAARPAASRARAAHRISAVSKRGVRRCGAAGRQCLGWRAARLDPEMQRLGDRSQRLYLLHRAGAGLGS